MKETVMPFEEYEAKSLANLRELLAAVDYTEAEIQSFLERNRGVIKKCYDEELAVMDVTHCPPNPNFWGVSR